MRLQMYNTVIPREEMQEKLGVAKQEVQDKLFWIILFGMFVTVIQMFTLYMLSPSGASMNAVTSLVVYIVSILTTLYCCKVVYLHIKHYRQLLESIAEWVEYITLEQPIDYVVGVRDTDIVFKKREQNDESVSVRLCLPYREVEHLKVVKHLVKGFLLVQLELYKTSEVYYMVLDENDYFWIHEIITTKHIENEVIVF